MRLTAENKKKIRDRIAEGAAALFREEGVDAVNLDQIMARAELTRGAFYAHFDSKAALFAEVIQHQHPILRMLQSRRGEDAAALWAELREIFANYLDPANLRQVFVGCSLAALTGEAARGGPAVRQGFEVAHEAIVAEMGRDQPQSDPQRLRAALMLASGAVTTAAACDGEAARASVLGAARQAFELLLETEAPLPDSRHT